LVVFVVPSTHMRLASVVIAPLIWSGSVPAQTRKYTPIPPAAAEVIATFPNARDLDSIRQNYVAAPLQLRDGVEAILVEGRGIGPCGAANCQAYILEKQGKTYRLLLDARIIQQTHVLNFATNGYHDIQTDMHGSATSADLRIYRYDGQQYRLNEEMAIPDEEKPNPRVEITFPDQEKQNPSEAIKR